MKNENVKTIAFYLPQFHPIPENDTWWGKGFTEWTNVTRSRPSFRGHRQPRLPADLGFYDLRLPETRTAQSALAKAFGIDGFCYYHYWFHGRRLLERPFDAVMESGRPDFPVCLCWANESWSRRWLGEERDILAKQEYSDEDDRSHSKWLARAFADPRYIRAGDRPLFLVYRPNDLPQPQRFVQRLGEAASEAGIPPPFIVGVDAHKAGTDFRTIGFDGTLGFEPQLSASGPGVFDERPSLGRLWRNLKLGIWSPSLQVFDEAAARSRMENIRRPEHTIPCCFVSWDNTPRRGKKAIVYVGGTPESFGRSLRKRYDEAARLPENQRFLFINAWNEWAEGNVLEPDATHGTAYLEEVSKVLLDAK